MACGTGKTLTALWIAEELEADLVLVLVPSLLLLSKTLEEWVNHASSPFSYLPVCSDASVSQREEEVLLGSSELGFPSTTSISEIRRFLRDSPGRKVIFSTYQSSPLLSEAYSLGDLNAFDLVIADEAHRCAGQSGSAFTTIVESDQIPADRKLFMTATPRVYAHSKDETSQGMDLVLSMDNEEVFGPVLHDLSFGSAISQGLLSDYRVVVAGVSHDDVTRALESEELIKVDGVGVVDSRSLASMIAIAKTVKKFSLKRMISFHSRVSRSREFTGDFKKFLTSHASKLGLNLVPEMDHIDGSMPTHKRVAILDKLANVGEDEFCLIGNAKCLSEGVDVPTLDGVAFVDPRRSHVDIVQAVGRAIRKADGKTSGYIVVPVFVDRWQNEELRIEESEYAKIGQVLGALKSHDETFGEQIEIARRGIRTEGSAGAEPDSRLVIDFPLDLESEFIKFVEAKVVAGSRDKWMNFYEDLVEFEREQGHTRVPFDFTTSTGNLGSWVSVQRKRLSKGDLPFGRRKLLEQIGFEVAINHIRADQFEDGLAALKSYLQFESIESGIPSNYQTSTGFKLGLWVAKQRTRAKNGQMTDSQRARLNELDFPWTQSRLGAQLGHQLRSRALTELRELARTRRMITPGDIQQARGVDLARWLGIQLSKERRRLASPGTITSIDSAYPLWRDLVCEIFDESDLRQLATSPEKVLRNEYYLTRELPSLVLDEKREVGQEGQERNLNDEDIDPIFLANLAAIREILFKPDLGELLDQNYDLWRWLNRQTSSLKKGKLKAVEAERIRELLELIANQRDT